MLFFVIFNFLLVLFIVISYLVWKKIVNPISIINVIFLIWMIVGRLGYLDQYIPSFESSYFIQINILILDAGIILGNGLNKINIRQKKVKNIKFDSVRIFVWLRRICFLLSIAILFNIFIGVITGRLLLTNIRNISYSVAFGKTDYTQIYFNNIIYYIYQYIVRGFAFFDLTFCFALFLRKQQKLPMLSVLNFILFIFIMQSRIEFLKIVIFMLIFLGYSNIKLSKMQKKILKRAIVIIGIVVLLILGFRSSNSEKGVIQNTIDSFIVDFSGSNYMFSQFFDQYNAGYRLIDSPIILKYLGGFGLLIEYILAMFGMKFNHNVVSTYLGQAHNIGSSTHYNAFYTMYFEFMNSGGYLGCFIFSLVFGVLIGYSFKRMNEKNSTKRAYIASFMTFIMAMGTYNYIIAGINALVIISCLIIANNKIKQNKIRER